MELEESCMLEKMVAKKGGAAHCRHLPGMRDREGKLEHFGAFLPWVMSKLELTQTSSPSSGHASRHAAAVAASHGTEQG